MPKCPHCGKEIDGLHFEGRVDCCGYASLTDKKEIELIGDDASGSYGDVFTCPECEKVIARNNTDAEKFLKGESTPEDLAKALLNTPENREKLAEIVVRDADLDDTTSMAINGCIRLYEEDDEKFLEDWENTPELCPPPVL